MLIICSDSIIIREVSRSQNQNQFVRVSIGENWKKFVNAFESEMCNKIRCLINVLILQEKKLIVNQKLAQKKSDAAFPNVPHIHYKRYNSCKFMKAKIFRNSLLKAIGRNTFFCQVFFFNLLRKQKSSEAGFMSAEKAEEYIQFYYHN